MLKHNVPSRPKRRLGNEICNSSELFSTLSESRVGIPLPEQLQNRRLCIFEFIVDHECIKVAVVSLLDFFNCVANSLRYHLLRVGGSATQALLQYRYARNIQPNAVGLNHFLDFLGSLYIDVQQANLYRAEVNTLFLSTISWSFPRCVP